MFGICFRRKQNITSLQFHRLFNSNNTIITENAIKETQDAYLRHREWMKDSDEAKKLVKSYINVNVSSVKSKTVFSFHEHFNHRNSNSNDTSNKIDIHSDNAMRLLSSTLTFPLTLAYGVNKIMNKKFKTLNIMVCGARSESSLPNLWWRELLYASSDIVEDHWDITMLGPDLQMNGTPGQRHTEDIKDIHNKNKKNVIHSNSNNIETTMSISQVPHGQTLLHNYPKDLRNELINSTDVFLLFNPGYGSDVLKEGWSPTLDILLQSGKPIIGTAHSRHDLNRDMEVLKQKETSMSINMVMKNHENPFKSQQRTVDEKEEQNAKIVTCNQFIYAFQGVIG